MDLGIKGKKAIVSAASKGLGKACAMSLAREGVDVTIIARNRDVLEATAQEIRDATGVEVIAIAADITTDQGIEEALAACNAPDIVVNNAGGPPLGDFRDWDRSDWIAALESNMLGAIFMIKAVVDGMIDRKFGRIVNITSSAVKAPIPTIGLSNGARAGLTGFVAGIARQTVCHNVTINAILPGPFDTDRLRSNINNAAKSSGREATEIAAEWAGRNPAGRFGIPEEFGDLCAYVCSQQAGFMTGQNLLLDGGSYPGTL